jgi:hypothetical protein
MRMFIVLLRSACVGIAVFVGATVLGVFVGIPTTIYFHSKNTPRPPGGGEVGWDLVSMIHNVGPGWRLLPLLIFVAGFLFGFRYFSKTIPRN